MSRRSVVGGAVGALIGGVSAARLGRVHAQQSTAGLSGDCEREAGVQLLLDWRVGTVLLTTEQLLPGADWKLYANPLAAIALAIPPGWEGELLWAAEFSRTGEPRWTTRQPAIHQLSSLRITSANGDAVFEYGIGSIQGQPLSTDVVADVATRGIVGDVDLRAVCAIDDPTNALSPNWFHADRVERDILITSGNALGLPDAYAPATIVSYFSMLGPRRDYEELMGTVFIPLLFQFSGGGGGGDEGDDDDDEEDEEDE